LSLLMNTVRDHFGYAKCKKFLYVSALPKGNRQQAGITIA
jgi:hypothetical protein